MKHKISFGTTVCQLKDNLDNIHLAVCGSSRFSKKFDAKSIGYALIVA